MARKHNLVIYLLQIILDKLAEQVYSVGIDTEDDMTFILEVAAGIILAAFILSFLE